MDTKPSLSEVFWQGVGYLPVVALIGAVVFGIVMLIRFFIKIAKQRQPKAIVYFILIIVCVAIMAVSWIFNMGWLRLALTFTTLPIVHAVVFAVVTGKALFYISLSKKLEKYTLLSFITYVGTYLLLPDGGDYGEMYALFTLIKSNVVAAVAMVLSFACLIANIVFLSYCSIETKKT